MAQLKLAAEAKAEIDKMTDEMNGELTTFAKKLDTKNLNKALEIKQQLEDKNQSQ